MRSLLLPLTTWFVLTFVEPVSAQPLPYQASVRLPGQVGVEVRSIAGTSAAGFTTNVLRQGDMVEVVQDAGNGWLGIAPPTCSFSWINERDVEMLRFPSNPDTLVVGHQTGGTFSVFMGSEVTSGIRGTIRGVQLKSGDQVRRVARAAVKDQEGTWIAIEAPYTEVRYIRAEVVRPAAGIVEHSAPPPEVRSPRAEKVQRVVLRMLVTEESRARDLLGMGRRVNERLRKALADTNSGLIYVDVSEFPGAIELGGRYMVIGDTVTFAVNLFIGEKDLAVFQVEGSRGKLDDLSERVVAEIAKRLARP